MNKVSFSSETKSYYESDAYNYGTDEAVILYNFRFWVHHNAIKNEKYYDGRFWVYYSQDDLVRLFPQFSRRQIQRIITNLLDRGAIKKGNYNKKKFDQTAWYSLNDQDEFLEIIDKNVSKYAKLTIAPNRSMESTESVNALNETVQAKHETVQPIPNINSSNINSNRETDGLPLQLIEYWNAKENLPPVETNGNLEHKIGKMIIAIEKEGLYPLDIINAIDNYAIVKESSNTWFKGSYGLASFLGINGRKGLFERFLSHNFVKSEYINGEEEINIDFEKLKEPRNSSSDKEEAEYLNTLFGATNGTTNSSD